MDSDQIGVFESGFTVSCEQITAGADVVHNAIHNLPLRLPGKIYQNIAQECDIG